MKMQRPKQKKKKITIKNMDYKHSMKSRIYTYTNNTHKYKLTLANSVNKQANQNSLSTIYK